MEKAEALTEKLQQALGARLRTVAVYGSAAAGNRTPRYSDVNLLLILDRADIETLATLSPLLTRWTKKGHKPPVIMVEADLEHAQEIFPIELSEIRDHHHLLHGDASLLSSLRVQPELLRRQLAFELQSKIFQFRQAFVAAAGIPAMLEDAMARSLSSMAALFRAVLRLIGEPVPSSTPDMLRALEKQVALDASAWETVWRWRHGERLPRNVAAESLFGRLLASVENVARFVDAQERLKEEK